jgi:cysteine desulfurase/selenocysteine lyase
LDLSGLDQLLSDRTKVVSFVHQSNLLGTVNDAVALSARAREVGAWVVIDACQSVPHMPIEIKELGADFVVFSGHKMCGPTGVGVLWGTEAALDALPVFITGGSMIETVYFDHSTYTKAPQKFEAGTQMAAQVVGLAAAVNYLNRVGMPAIAEHEHLLTEQALAALNELKGVRIVGPENAHNRGSAISFVVDSLHPHDVGQVLDSRGVAVRVGHHCAWPTCRRFEVPATTRASFYLYNEASEIESLTSGIVAAQKFFGVL